MNKPLLTIIKPETKTELPLPFADAGIRAGFPSPAQDYMQEVIDLNKELIKHPASTFFARVNGDSMIDANVHDGDLLVIDKDMDPAHGLMAVCYIDGEFTLKFIKKEDDCIWLMPANNKYKPIKVTPDNEFIVWGIVRYIIHKPEQFNP